MIKKIALISGGGDCAGVNAFLAAAVRKGIEGYGAEFVGIRRALEGASADNVEEHMIPLGREQI